jgi:glycosyltransferase involved in cell wall biosynthesis
MRLTVAICTWNRADLLSQTLERMTTLEVPSDVEWELLVVNNNCTDATEEIVTAYLDRLPVRKLYEPEPGKSHALNRAVMGATGEYILFTDDDVLVDPRWIASYAEAFRRWPDAVIFGGPILPWFEGTPPDWLSRTFHRIEFAFAALDLGSAFRQFSGDDVPFGANMAVRSAEQKAWPYDPSLGPRPNSGLRGEEITLLKAMLRAGATGWWIPGARVKHFIPKGRQTIEYVRGWYQGWGEYLAQVTTEPGERTLLGRPLWLWRELLESELRFRVRRHLVDPETWIEDLKTASIARGRFAPARIRR